MADQFELPTVIVWIEGEDLVVQHRKTGMVARIPLSRLDTWCLRILRAELSN